MKSRPFYFEIKDLVTQFLAAFDDTVIQRYNENRESEGAISVRYVYAPKQRVLYDIINQAKNLTLPVVSVSITSISRDTSRVFNKIGGFYYGTQNKSTHMLTPVPVNISISMSIITKYQTDMDQILSNFIPYSNPYIIISWKVPDNIGLPTNQEIRSTVLWDENISITYPTELTAVDKYRCVCDTSFTIKGWLFKAPEDTVGKIWYVSNNFFAERNITTYDDLSSNTYSWPISTGLLNETEFVGVSANP